MLKTIAMGRLGADARINNSTNNQFVSFQIAINNGKDKDGNDRPATWVECTYTLPENSKIADYLKKGAIILVEGTPHAGTFTKEDGTTISTLKIYAKNIELAGK